MNALLLSLLLAAADAPVAPVAAAHDVVQTLVLIGDAGEPALKGESVMDALAGELARDPSRTAVLFLGDNLYPSGLGPVGTRERAEQERRLDKQVEVVRASGALGIFVPGNHDWAGEKEDGWNAIRREGERIDAVGAPSVEMLPKGGCPGPAVRDVGATLRLVLLDTQWWLHAFAKPRDPDSSCAQDSEAEVLAALNDALQTAGTRHVVVAAHHPLASGGPHGGYFTLKQHLFPLTELKKSLWIPLPIIGSIYPLARQAGHTPQDLSSAENTHMRNALETVLKEHPPLVFAAGHEHTLQVLGGTSARHLLVSGAGIYDHESSVKKLPQTRYASGSAGFMRLEVERAGRVRLAVIEVDKDGKATEAYAQWLE